jgi:hypothetical protein
VADDRGAVRRADEQARSPGWRRASTKSSRTSAPARSTGAIRLRDLEPLVVKCRDGGRTVNVCVGARGQRQRGLLPRVARPRRRHRRGRSRLARLHARLDRARPQRREAGQLGRHPGLVDAIAATLAGAVWRRCGHPTSCATLDARAQERAAVRRDHDPHDLCSTRRRDEGALAAAVEQQLARALNKEIRPRTDVVGIFSGKLVKASRSVAAASRIAAASGKRCSSWATVRACCSCTAELLHQFLHPPRRDARQICIDDHRHERLLCPPPRLQQPVGE